MSQTHPSDWADPHSEVPDTLCRPRAYLDVDLTLTREQMERLSQQIASRVVSMAIQLRHFFLVEDLVDSLKVPPKPPLPSWVPSFHLAAPGG